MRKDLARLETEKRNLRTTDIDIVDTAKVLEMINEEDQTVAFVVQKQLPAITALTDAYIRTLENGGRVFYIGAGTSGRLGFIDAAELIPTYNIQDGLVEGIMAGGLPAMKRAKEFEEDKAENGTKDLKERNFCEKDMLIGVAASGRTPYVINAMQYARSLGAVTGSISCVSDAEMSAIADYPVEVVTGQEVVLGSTRMKAATAEKLVLNMMSTAAFIRTGRTYKNYLLGQTTTEKAYYRQIRWIANEVELPEEEVEKFFKAAGNDSKLALCMIKTGLSAEESRELIERHGGRLREALHEVGSD
ncbi:MAG: N-acetylmuramic acid 6-phosphate etherase [Erysipelotrichaceae bacterium]|nr:N-acetylmuramic acid 6-phosphate etherase [Erysipelotrichaceae bacterium]